MSQEIRKSTIEKETIENHRREIEAIKKSQIDILEERSKINHNETTENPLKILQEIHFKQNDCWFKSKRMGKGKPANTNHKKLEYYIDNKQSRLHSKEKYKKLIKEI